MSMAYRQSAAGVAGDFSSRIDSLFSEWNRDNNPGATIAVVSRGMLIHQRGYGVANVEDDIPFSGDTVFRLGSTSKHLCATCVLILENRGKLDLDDDVRIYVPEMPDYDSVITLRHLLTMTSGLWDGINVLLFCGLDSSSKVTRQQMLALFQCQRRLMYTPGDDCQYSNSNYALLSLVIERVSGKTLADFMQEEIFGPLGMHDTLLIPFDTRVTHNKARGYIPSADGPLESGLMHIELCGDGGVDSTLADMTRWFLNYRNDQYFGPDYRKRIEAENRLNGGQLVDYRLGMTVGEYRGLEKVRHSGGMPGYLCDFVFYPQQDLGIILFTNVFDAKMLELPDRVADIVLENKLKQLLQSTFVSENDPDSTMLRGVFASEAHQLIAEIVANDGHLVCYLLGDAKPLMALGDNRFAPADKSVVIEQAESSAKPDSGERPAIKLFSGNQPAIELQPVADPRLAPRPNPAGLYEYTGRYFSDELQETHELTVQDGFLHVHIPSPTRDLVWSKLVPVCGDLFGALIDGEPSCSNVAVRFLRDENSSCTGLSYSISRCTDVRFRKSESNS
jgi:CubicO group peptidase (beta-lactamase class C family)